MGNIWVAAGDGEVEAVKGMLASGTAPDVKDPNGYTPVHAAASYGHVELLRLLVQAGGNINVQDNEGDTPLHHVEDAAVARVMVEELGADIKAKNGEGKTAADFVEDEDEFPELVQYLRGVSGGAASALVSDLPAPDETDHAIRYTYQRDEEEEESEEVREQRRKVLEEIVKSENPEEALRELITLAVRDNLASEEGVKRRR